MPIAAAASAAATIGSAVIGSSAAKSAAKTQAAAADQATQAQLDIYGQNKATLAPFIGQGSNAGSALAKLLGTDGSATTPPPQLGGSNWAAYVNTNPDVLAAWNQPGVQQAWNGDINAYGQAHYDSSGKNEGRAVPTFSQSDVSSYVSPQEAELQNLPGYQFTRDQGVQSVNRQLGSMGLTGAQAKGISRFVTGLADSTYNSQVANLQNATNTGEGAAAAQAGVGSNTGSSISNTIVGAGSANAAGTIGAANAATGALGQIPSYLLANKLLGGGTGSASSGIYGAAYNGANIDPAALGG